MYVTSKAGTEILKSQYEIIDSINGIPTLETDYSQLKHNHTEPMLMLSPAFNDKYIMVLKEQESVTESSRLRLTGVHSFIYDFSLDRIYEEFTRYFSLENILTLVFSDTEYDYEVSGSTRYNALEFENFGNNDKMNLINQICDRWELEYRVKGNKVYFADQRGTKTTKQFRYKMNIHDSHVNLDISEGATYIRAYFGKKDEENPSNSTYVEKEMLHPLAEDFGVRHAKPYSNEVITQEETMQRYMKMKIEETWKLSVEIDVLDLSGDGSAEVGDEVWAIDERMDLKYKTRIVEKRDYYDVNDRIYRTKVVLGNKTFIEAVSAQEVTAEDLEYEVRRYTNKRIEQLKAEKDNDFNAIRDTLRSEFSDALAQSKIEVAADFDRMEKLLDTKSDEWTEDFNQSVAESKNYAEQQAQEKADNVRTDLETVTSGHQAMIDGLKDNVINIDEFLGDSRDVTLDERLLNINQNFDERIRNIDSSVYNMLRDTRFDENFWRTFSGSTIQTDESINYARFNLTVNNQPNIRTSETLRFDEGTQYRIVIEYRTDAVPELDYVYLFPSSGGDIDINAVADGVGFRDLNTDGQWNKRVLTFTPNITLDAVLAIGSRRSTGDGTVGIIDVRLPYLTTTSNVNWVYHPLDATQNISEVTRRVTNLEDGYSELTTRNEFDFATGKLDQHIKSVESTVEGNYQVLQRVEDWQATNGASIEETIYGFNQKVWLNDFASIGANLVPQSERAWENGGIGILSGAETNTSSSLRTKQYIPVEPSMEYTFKDNSLFNSSVRYIDVHQYAANGAWVRHWRIERGGSHTFTTWSNTATVRIGLVSADGFSVLPRFIENPDKRIHLKLEKGDTATPMINALSRIEQIADKINMTVVELDGTYLKQSDFQLTPNYWQLGAMRIGAEDVSSVLRGSPDAIDAVVSEFNLTGNLNAKGQITSLAVDAIEGNFARLFANQLTANVITSDHIQVGTALVDKMFATSARIDELITKNHFVTNVKAMSIEAVEGQFSTLFTRYLSVNYIDVDYVNGKNAWFETQYVKSANISNLTSQTAFIGDIQAIEVTANQLNIQTLHSKLAGTEGGLTIYGPDGRVLINNSVLRASFDAQIFDSYAGSGVDFGGLNFVTSSSFWQTFKYFYTDFKGSQLLISWAVGIQSGNSSSEYAEVQVRGFGGSSNPIGTRSSRQLVKVGETTYHNQIITLGVPNYNTIQAYLEFRRSPTGTHIDNRVTARILRVSMIN